MAGINRYPITDFNNLNLDWLVEQTRENTDDISDLSAGVSGNAAAIQAEADERERVDDDLQDQIDAIQAGAALDRMLNVDSKRQVIFIADSYGLVNSPCFCDKAASALGISASNYQLIAKGSAGFQRAVYDVNYTFLHMLQTATITLSPSLVTDIIVCGGANDIGANTADLYTAIQNFANYCHATYINAKVSVYFTAYRMDISNSNAYVNCYNDMAYGCGLAGVKFANLSTALHSLGLLASDKIHPNGTGDASLGRALAIAMVGGDPQSIGIGQNNFTMTIVAPCVSIGAWAISNAITNGLLYVHFTGNQTWQFDDTSAINCNGGTWYKLADITGGNLMVNSAHTYATVMSLNVTIFFMNGDVLPATMDVRIRNCELHVRFWCLKNSAWKNGAIDRIITGSGSFTLDPIRN